MGNPQMCPANVPHKCAPQMCPTNVPYKCAPKMSRPPRPGPRATPLTPAAGPCSKLLRKYISGVRRQGWPTHDGCASVVPCHDAPTAATLCMVKCALTFFVFRFLGGGRTIARCSNGRWAVLGASAPTLRSQLPVRPGARLTNAATARSQEIWLSRFWRFINYGPKVSVA